MADSIWPASRAEKLQKRREKDKTWRETETPEKRRIRLQWTPANPATIGPEKIGQITEVTGALGQGTSLMQQRSEKVNLAGIIIEELN